jgi:hypothetical protein
VGEARIDAVGNVFLRAKRRTGKGSSRAQQSGGRLVDQGEELQVRWLGAAVASIDPKMEHRNWEAHRRAMRGALPGHRLIGFYWCSDGRHWVGSSDIDELLGWIDKALELGVRKVPLQPIAETEIDRVTGVAGEWEIPMESV